MSQLPPAPVPTSALLWGLAPWQHALGKEPVGFCEGLRHALECPLQDPVPGALWDSPGFLLSLSIPLPERPPDSPSSPCLVQCLMSPCGSHQKCGPLWIGSACCCPPDCHTSPRSASSSSLLSMGSPAGATSSACRRRHGLPTFLPALCPHPFGSGLVTRFSPSPTTA